MLRVERSKPEYMVTEKLDRDKLKRKTGMKAWKFKRKLKESRGWKLARVCWEEIKAGQRGERQKTDAKMRESSLWRRKVRD